ncbi:tuftelin 1b isoform X2 [Cyclopterus lumpus]|uniref:tuftelin 1b isoform X2 n=1 Tax=Cyclopterus lumpus TaxID=8103 RepID=UPI001485E4CE|nr:tuftelin 1b isoform X2 [Cyclopterus lumpus]
MSLLSADKMSGGVRTGEEDIKEKVQSRRFRFTLQDQDQSDCTSERHSNKEGSIAVVLPQKPAAQEETLISTNEERVEVLKVYLQARPEAGESVNMMTDEVSQIQEVRYCLKTLREQMAARQNSNNNKYPANVFRVNLSSSPAAVSNGNAVLTESDTQAESHECSARLAEQSEQLQTAEKRSEERGQQVEELQRLLGSMAIESRNLKDKMAEGEAELLQLKADQEEGEESEERCEELEKEVAILKEKIHHLDDMLKSQQRKVRHMIEQLQNSRTVLQERDRFIGDLEEKVAFLEAENREMHDHLDYFLAGQESPPLESTVKKPEVVYSKTLTPRTQTNKALPFIKVIELKS